MGLMHLWTASALEICLLSGLFVLWCLLPWWDWSGFLTCWTWLSWLQGSTLWSIENSSFLPLHTATFPVLSRADSSGLLKQTVLRRKLLAPPPKMVGDSVVHLRLDNLKQHETWEQVLHHPVAEPTNRECYKLNLEGKLLNQGFLSRNWCGVINNLLCSICNLAGASIIFYFFLILRYTESNEVVQLNHVLFPGLRSNGILRFRCIPDFFLLGIEM